MTEILAPIAGRTKHPLSILPQWNRIVKWYGDTATLGTDIARNNRNINSAYAYIPENIDYWSNSDEFNQNGGGDCEDFAIFKFCTFALPKYIAVGMLKESGLTHAVLIVYSHEYGNWEVLDCMTNEVVGWKEYQEKFTPAYLCDTDGVYL